MIGKHQGRQKPHGRGCHLRNTCVASLLLFLWNLQPTDAWGSAQQLYTHGAAASASSWCVTARPLDASTVYFNPAGMSHLKGTHFLVGGSGYFLSVDYTAPEAENNESIMSIFPSLFYHAVHTFDRGISVGLGIYSPFGLGAEFDSDWEGRYIFTRAFQAVVEISPCISVDLQKLFPSMPRISVGGGYRFAYCTTNLKQHVTFQPLSILTGGTENALLTNAVNLLLRAGWTGEDTTATLDVDGFGHAFNVGLLWQVTDDLSVGMTYRSKIELDTSGTADFYAPGMNPQLGSLFFVDDDVSVLFEYPDTIALGVAYRATETLDLEFDFYYGNWHNFSTLNVEFENPANTDMALPQNFTNSYFFGLAAEIRHFSEYPIRVGAAYEFTPIPDETYSPIIADNDRIYLSGGFSHKVDHLPLIPDHWTSVLDFYYLYAFCGRDKQNEIPHDIRTAPIDGVDLEAVIDMAPYQANGNYFLDVHVIGFSLALNF